MNAYKGKLSYDPTQCIVCQTCAFVCPAGAINITCKALKQSYDFIIWHNSCTLCGNCTYFCPTGAIALSDVRAEALPQSQKYTAITSSTLTFDRCPKCAEPMIKTPEALLNKGFSRLDDSVVALFSLCPKCRRESTFTKRVL